MNANGPMVATVALLLRARRPTAGQTRDCWTRVRSIRAGRWRLQSGSRECPFPRAPPARRRPRLQVRADGRPNAYAPRATGAGFVPGETAGARWAYPSGRIVEAFCG